MGLGVLLSYLFIVGNCVYWWRSKQRPIGVVFAVLGGFVPWVALSAAESPTVNGIVAPLAGWFGSAVVFVIGWRLPAKGMKSCPACAEAVKREAAVCRYCGHAF